MSSLKVFLLFSLFLVVMSVMLCGISYSATGSVPKVNSIYILGDWTIELPFGVSRWWDILFGPLWAAIFVLVLSAKKVKNEEGLLFEFIVLGVLIGCGISLCAVVGMFYGLVALLTAGLVAGFIASLMLNMGLGPGAGLGAFLSVGIIVGMKNGFVIGFPNGLVLGLGLCVGVFLGVVFKKLKQKLRPKQERAEL